MPRKGISPLIAAVMLIAFVMAIGGIFSQWTGTLFNDATQRNTDEQDKLLDCSDLSLEFVEINEDYSNGYLNVTLKSNGGDAGNVTVRASPSYETEYVEMNSSGQVEVVSLDTSTQQDALRADSQRCAISTTENLG